MSPVHPSSAPHRVVDVELLALDLSRCTRCVGTLENIEAGVAAVRQALELTGTTVRLHKVVVESADEARRLRFASSPTVRIAGRDIAFDTQESRCDACTDLCGCSEGTSCRVWSWQGAEYTEAPVGLIVEALLRELAGDGARRGDVPRAPYELPANLRRFYAGREARSAAPSPAVSATACCSTSEQATCCEPADKVVCCSAPTTALEPASCGCR